MTRPKAPRWGKRGEFFADLLHDRPDFAPAEAEGWDGQRGRQMFSFDGEDVPARSVEAWRLWVRDGASLRSVGRQLGVDHAMVRKLLDAPLRNGTMSAEAVREIVRRELGALRFLASIFGPRGSTMTEDDLFDLLEEI